MVRSMTGFGQSGRSINGYRIRIDLKSVNHRYCEIVVRMPREWLSCEDRLKKQIQLVVKRGRVDAFITVEREAIASDTVTIDWPLADAYWEAAKQMKQRYDLTDSLTVRELILIPELIKLRDNPSEADQTIGEQMVECLSDALAELMFMRETEGKHLLTDLAERLALLEKLHTEMLALSAAAVSEYQDKLRNRIQDLLRETSAFDEHRFAMEVALMAERSNVDEELTRLRSHCDQCRTLLHADEPVGRKLDFLIQEMNREANTIGSKAGHTELINKVVEMKAELEKIREQVQNIE